MHTIELVKVQLKKTGDFYNYATLDTICALLHEFASKKDLPVFDILKILITRRVDSLSFTRDDPYFYFYSRLDVDGVLIKSSDHEKEVEMHMSAEALRTIIESTKNP
jgi:hypothetical protein